MKSYYADYVAHGTRFYLKNRQLKRFTNTIDEINWKVSRLTYKELNDYERKVVYDFYVEKNAENWEIILKFEKEWARKRGLI